jgi:hypothetical protein
MNETFDVLMIAIVWYVCMYKVAPLFLKICDRYNLSERGENILLVLAVIWMLTCTFSCAACVGAVRHYYWSSGL